MDAKKIKEDAAYFVEQHPDALFIRQVDFRNQVTAAEYSAVDHAVTGTKIGYFVSEVDKGYRINPLGNNLFPEIIRGLEGREIFEETGVYGIITSSEDGTFVVCEDYEAVSGLETYLESL